MSTEYSFESFLTWGLDNYSGEQMGVVIAGHGGGIAGCAYDDNNFKKIYTDYELLLKDEEL